MKYFIYVALVSVVAMTVMASDAPGSTAEPADSKVIALNAETFDSFLNANKNKPVMIEFYAKWYVYECFHGIACIDSADHACIFR